jgi:hypothetical protein
VFDHDLSKESRERDRARSRARLRWAPDEVPVHLGALLDDAHGLVQWIKEATSQPGELAPAQA